MDNISKILHYVRPVLKIPISVDGKDITESVTKIKLASTLFCVDGCHCCGHCCPSESNVYVQSEYDKISSMTDEQFKAEGYVFSSEGFETKWFDQLKDKLYREEHEINGKPVPFYIYKLDKNTMYFPEKSTENKYRDMCSWVYKDEKDGLTKCHIHPIRSITCDMPHLRFDYNERAQMLIIAIRQFGRNWALGCQVILQQPQNKEQFESAKQNRLNKLNHLKEVVESLQLNVDETYIPEIIDYINDCTFDNYTYRLDKDILHLKPNTHKLF